MNRFDGNPNSKILILGDWPSKNDEKVGRIFSDFDGTTLRRILSQAGINPTECCFGVCVLRYPLRGISEYFDGKGLNEPNTMFMAVQNVLKEFIQKHRPNIVVPLGRFALRALTNETILDRVKGTVMASTLVPGIKVLPVNHPEQIRKDYLRLMPTIMDFKKVRTHSRFPELPKDNRRFKIAPSKQEFLEFADFLCSDEVTHIAYDIETISPGPHIDWIAFAPSKDYAVALQFMSGKRPCWSEQDEIELIAAVNRILTSSKKLITQNGQYDMSVLFKNWGILPRKFFFDTMIAGHACWPQLPKSLNFLSSMYLDRQAWKHTAQSSRGLYNAKDTATTFELYEVLDKELDRLKTRDTFNLEMNCVEPAMMMGLQGVRVDKERKAKLVTKTEKSLAEVKKALNTLTQKTDVNYTSPKQVAKLLYDELGFPAQYKRRTSTSDPRVYTTDKEAMDKVARLAKDHPLAVVPKLVIEYRKLSSLLTAKLTVEPNPRTGRVYTSYNVCGQDQEKQEDPSQSMGRWSSSRTIIWTELE